MTTTPEGCEGQGVIVLLFAEALPPWPAGVPPLPWPCGPAEPDRSVVLVTDSTVVVVVVVAVTPAPVAFAVLVRLIGFEVVFGFTCRTLCTCVRLWTALVVVFGLAAEDFSVTDLACVWAWP